MTAVRLQVTGGAVRPQIALRGEVDASNADDLAERIASAVGNDALGVVLDLSEVTYLDSSGIRLVFRLARGLRDRQQDLHLVVPAGSRLRRPLELSGVGTVAQVVPDQGSLPLLHAEGA